MAALVGFVAIASLVMRGAVAGAFEKSVVSHGCVAGVAKALDSLRGSLKRPEQGALDDFDLVVIDLGGRCAIKFQPVLTSGLKDGVRWYAYDRTNRSLKAYPPFTREETVISNAGDPPGVPIEDIDRDRAGTK